MTSPISKLVLAAVVAAAVPVAASPCDHRDPREAAAPWRLDAPHRWREVAWRERELTRIRAELQALDAERAEFHARFAWNPRKLRRYDRSYVERRAELERRWAELQPVAWR